MWRISVVALAMLLGGCLTSEHKLFRLVGDEVPLAEGTYICSSPEKEKPRIRLARMKVAGGFVYRMSSPAGDETLDVVFRKVSGDRYLAISPDKEEGARGQNIVTVRIRDDRVDFLRMRTDDAKDSAALSLGYKLTGDPDSQRTYLMERARRGIEEVVGNCALS